MFLMIKYLLIPQLRYSGVGATIEFAIEVLKVKISLS
jgi:hypothetical protein